MLKTEKLLGMILTLASVLLFPVTGCGDHDQQGPVIKEDASRGMIWKVKNNELFVQMRLCKMVKDCGSLDVNEIELLLSSEDGVFANITEKPKVIGSKSKVYQYTLAIEPCQYCDRRNWGNSKKLERLY